MCCELKGKMSPITLNGEVFTICEVEDLKDKVKLEILINPDALA